MRIKKIIIIFLLFFLAGILSRALFASKDFTHVDDVLYALGSLKFSIRDGTPPPPGYFLYIMSARWLNILSHNPHTSLTFISIFYSGLIAGILYYFGSLLKDQRVGIVSALLFLTSPLFWYKGITIYAYLNSGFFILMVALLSYKIVVCKERNPAPHPEACLPDKQGPRITRCGINVIFWFSVCIAILLGVRPQEFPLVLPLYIYVLFHLKIKEAISSIVIFSIFCLLWVVPLISMSGGIANYLSSLKPGTEYIATDIIFTSNLLSRLNNHLVRMCRYFEWAYFLGIVPLVYYIGRFFYLPNFVRDKKIQFFAIWISPTVIYNLLIQFGEIGHGMNWGLGLLLITAEAIIVLCEDIQQMLIALSKVVWQGLSYVLQSPYRRGITYVFVLSPIILTNLFMFFYDFDKDNVDFYGFERYRQFNYRDVSRRNQFLTSKIDFIKSNFTPENIVIISSGTFGYQVMYHLDRAIVIQCRIINKKSKPGFSVFYHFRHSDYQDKNEFIIPKGITKLILFDDIYVPYFQNKERATYYEIRDSYKLFACDVSSGERIILDYHFIGIE